MRLVSFDGQRIGVLKDQRVVDVTDLVPGDDLQWPPVLMVRTIACFPDLAAKLAAAAAAEDGVPLSEVRLAAPVQWPNKVIAYPTNYDDHITEMRSSGRSDRLGYFLKANSSLCGPADPIVLPEIDGREVHHEAELAVIIGRRGRHIAAADALGHVFGYTCLIDVTIRGTQERVMRKSFDTFCPLGPAIVTSDEVPDPDALDISLSVNGEPRQRGNTRDMILGVAEMISLASSVSTLEPGDVIATGTPAGVGPIRDGDVVSMSITGIGELTARVVQGAGGSNKAFENR
jgi:2-keto-4-pentenoate hydratase/2-oxohepta-3-ene-1,7-dioic acid hydratase in catechol pathway